MPNSKRSNTSSRYFGSGTWKRGTTTGRTSSFRTTTSTGFSGRGQNPASGYTQVNNTFAQKIAAYKTLYSQTFGPAKFGRPSPSTLNTFANWVNKGCTLQTVSPTQLARWSRTTKGNFNFNTTSGCKNILAKKFGKTAIKAVTRLKDGQFLIACSPTINTRAFSFPH